MPECSIGLHRSQLRAWGFIGRCNRHSAVEQVISGMQTSVIESLGAVLDLIAPPVSKNEARELASTHFGMDGVVRGLAGERDRNFHLRDSAGREYVVKIAHPEEDPDVIDLQSKVLQHVAFRDPALPVPRVMELLSGSGTAFVWEKPGTKPRLVRVLSYLPGYPLAEAEPTHLQCSQIGATLARLDRALQGFSHPAEGHDLLWDLQQVARVRKILPAIADSAHRGLAHKFLDHFEMFAAPVMDRLRRQVIHNDFNPHNILSDSRNGGKISGIIDFGDVVCAPLVQDLAVAAAYHIGPESPPLDKVSSMVAAYHAGNPLTVEEIEILPDLLGARLVLSVAIGSWRAARDPGNAAYITRNLPKAWNGLAGLDCLSRTDAQATLKSACRMG